MKLTFETQGITNHSSKYVVEYGHNDVVLDEYLSMCKAIGLALGFSPNDMEYVFEYDHREIISERQTSSP